MAHFVTSVLTPRSPDEAFAYMLDVRNFAAWDPGVRQAVRVAGDGTAVGSAYDLTVVAGATTVMRYTLTELEPPRRLVLRSRTTFLTSVDEVRVEAAPGGGARVTYDAVLTLNGPLRLFDRALGVAFRKIGDRAAAGLRRALDGTEAT